MRSYFITEEESKKVGDVINQAYVVARNVVEECKERGTKAEIRDSRSVLGAVGNIREKLKSARFDKDSSPFRGYQLILEDREGDIFDSAFDLVGVELPDIERRKNPKVGKSKRKYR